MFDGRMKAALPCTNLFLIIVLLLSYNLCIPYLFLSVFRHHCICWNYYDLNNLFLWWGANQLHISSIFTQNGYFSHSCCSDGCIWYVTQIEKWQFRLKCGVNELHTKCSSWDIVFCLFQPSFNQNGYFSHLRCSDGCILY